MKKIAVKRMLTFICCIIFSAVFCLSSSALSANEYGLGLSVNCEENGIADITLKNSNSFDVDGVSFTFSAPEELQLISGESANSIGTLKANESYKAALSFEPAIEQVAVEIPQPEAVEGNKGTDYSKITAAAFAAVAIAAVIAILVKKRRKATALILAFTIIFPFVGMFSVHALGIDEERSFTLDTFITVDGKEYPLSVTVNYTASTAKNSYFEFDTAPEEAKKDAQTVKRLTTDFSGTATANEAVKTVTYEIKSEIDGYKNAVTGKASLNGCDWSADSLALKPGKNEITFTAALENGETQTQTYELTYDRGTPYQAKQSEIKEENGHRYVNNVINIYFGSGISDERIDEILHENKLVRIGEINGVFLVQARANTDSLEELKALCEKIQSLDEVCLAVTEDIVDIALDTVSNDPWHYDPAAKETWNEDLPNGNNWSIEAVEALSAWKYESYFNTVKVGIVDGGILVNHEDFADGLIKFSETMYQNGNVSSDHGTHVAGIIGATRNNAKGGSGLLSKVEIYAASYSVGNSSSAVTNIINAVTSQVEHGAKAVNLSIGLEKAYDGVNNPYENPYSPYNLASTAGPCAVGMYNLLSQNIEFVVVQSAGNGTLDTRFTDYETKRSDDATQNGLYCSVNPDHRYTGYYGSMTKNDIQSVYNRIIVVGGVRNYTSVTNGATFKMFYLFNEQKGTIALSNGGDRVDIYAPGYNVLSSITDRSFGDSIVRYAWMTGTSQAAPIVTAIAAMCFAINPAFTGEQVRNIICDDANSTRKALDYSLIDANTGLDYHPFEGDGKVINMKLCAEAALKTVCGKASYAYLNRVVAAAQSLDPNAYTNYEIVQSVIDSIDYNLYEFEQDKVSDKANELIAAMDKLEEKDPADYTKVDEAVAKANALDATHYVDFSGVTNAVNAVVYGKYSDEQEAVDKMAQDILDAIDALELLCKIESSDSEVIADNNKQIIVISPEKIESMLNCLDAGAYSISFSTNKNGVHSTGSAVILSDGDDSTSDIVYTVIAVGDINGDGCADGEDAVIANLCVNGIIQPDGIYTYAYDANCDGSITAEDVELLEQVGLYNDVIINFYEPEAAA